LLCVLSLLSLPGVVSAESVRFSQDLVADYEFSLVGGTAINPGPTTPFIPFQARGVLTFELDPSLNDSGRPTTVPFVNVTGTLLGVFPAAFLPHVISPDVEFLGGVLTNIVRDSNGEVTSANVQDLSMRWELVGTPLNIRLFTKVGLPSDGAVTSIPFAEGTVLAGAAEFEVFLDDGGSDPLVAMGRNRTLTSVPEPSAAALAGMAALTLGLAAARRRREIEMACPEYPLEPEGSANRQDHYNSTSARENEVTCKASFMVHRLRLAQMAGVRCGAQVGGYLSRRSSGLAQHPDHGRRELPELSIPMGAYARRDPLGHRPADPDREGSLQPEHQVHVIRAVPLHAPQVRDPVLGVDRLGRQAGRLCCRTTHGQPERLLARFYGH
jgi:MYXO-CTERM domain-containing protein